MTAQTKEKEMHNYYIYTDAGQWDEFEAESVYVALARIGFPQDARSLEGFIRYLKEAGGYGAITEDGVVVARVEP